MAKIENINVNELQAKISKIIKKVQNGTIYYITRYSEPQAVMMSAKEYEKIEQSICNKCAAEVRKALLELKKR